MGLYLLLLPSYLRADAEALFKIRAPTEDQGDAVNYLRQVTAPEDLVISDEPMLPLLADRRILPG